MHIDMRIFLYPFTIPFAIVIFFRNLLYDYGIFKIKKLNKPVISIGNISMGGTGKTPIIEMLITYFLKNKKKIAVISRGYKRKSQGPVIVSDGKELLASSDNSGDEPFQIAKKFPNVVVGVDSDRVRIASLMDKKYSIDLFLLDDAFQHRKIYRDIDILTINARMLPYTDHLFPYGTRRDILNSMKRADVSLITKNFSNNYDEIANELNKYANTQTFNTRYDVVSINNYKREVFSNEMIKGRKVIIFCGIADPNYFKIQVESLGAMILKTFYYRDHYDFTIKDINNIFTYANINDVDIMLTTEKDFSRLFSKIDDLNKKIIEKLYYICINVKIETKEQIFYKLLDEKLYARQ
jgi:tetraacyldisaccharide 4'-kinase